MCTEGRIQEAENSRSRGGQDVTRLMCLFRESHHILEFLASRLLEFSPFTPRSSPRAHRYLLVHRLPGARQRSGTVDRAPVGSFRPLEAPERLAETRQ